MGGFVLAWVFNGASGTSPSFIGSVYIQAPVPSSCFFSYFVNEFWEHEVTMKKELAFVFFAYVCTPNSPSPAYLLVCVCGGHKPMLLFLVASQFYFVRQGTSLKQESTFGIHWPAREPLRSAYV